MVLVEVYSALLNFVEGVPVVAWAQRGELELTVLEGREEVVRRDGNENVDDQEHAEGRRVLPNGPRQTLCNRSFRVSVGERCCSLVR